MSLLYLHNDCDLLVIVKHFIIGFGKRVQKPKGPRKEPDSWSRWNFAS